MCLTLNDKSKLEIAKKDITVYKVVLNRGDELKTLFQKNTVHIGKTYRSRIICELAIINVALHSFKSLTKARMFQKHNWFFKNVDTLLIKCIIPAGSKYIKGTFNYNESYASNKLKYVEIVPPLIRKRKKIN